MATISQNEIQETIEATEKESNVPVGYIPMELSTRGKLGAPAVFHIRNLSTEEVMQMSLVDDEDLPEKTLEILRSLIYEEDIDPATWHEAEVIEALVRLYKEYYSPILKEQKFTPDDTDWEYLEQKYGKNSERFMELKRDIENGNWDPHFNIDLNAISYYAVKDDFKANIAYKSKDGSLTCVYTYPRYGDIVKVKKYIDTKFKNKDKQFESLAKIYRFRKEAEEKVLKGQNINLNGIGQITKEDEKKLHEYDLEKTRWIVTAMRAIQIIEIDGKDVSELPFDKRMELVQDPRFDYASFKKIAEMYAKLPVGIKKEISVDDPIMMQRRDGYVYSFRVYDVLSAFRDQDTDDDSYNFV